MLLSNQNKKICIFGINVGNLNLGDEATFTVVLKNIRQRIQDVRLYALCNNPEETTLIYGIPAFPIKRFKNKYQGNAQNSKDMEDVNGFNIWEILGKKIKFRLKQIHPLYISLKMLRNFLAKGFYFLPDCFKEMTFLLKSFSSIRGTNLFIVAGGGVLSDHFGGPLNFPYSLLKWSAFAKVSGAKLAFLSVGAGPINSWLSKLLLKYSLSLGDYHSFRDDDSRRLIENIGVRSHEAVFPDLVHSLKIESASIPSSNLKMGYIIGINPFPYSDPRFWPSSDIEVYRRYITKLACFVSWLMENNYTVVFFPMQLKADPPVINDIKDILKKDLGRNYSENSLESPVHGLDDMISRISTMDLVIATRFHGILLSFLMNKPVIGISNHPKMDNLMRDMGQGKYLLSIDSFNVETLKDRFNSLKNNSESIKITLQPIISNYRLALENQYDRLFALLETR